MVNTKTLVLIFIGFFILIFIIVLLLVFNQNKKPDTQQNSFLTPTIVQQKESLYVKFVPGKTTYDEVVKSLGNPTSIRKVGNKTYIWYPTAYSALPNVFVFTNGVLLYDIENFFGDYKKSLNFYTSKYGQPELSLFDKNDDTVEWMLFPKYGIALCVFSFDSSIVKIMYFVPQTKESFEKNFSEELGLIKTNVHEVLEVSPAVNDVFAPEILSPTPAP